jgi:dTDP-4-dehydrorhamnose 3,5-epimerase
MKFMTTKINDVFLIQPKVFKDHRGFLFESFKETNFKKQGIDFNCVQQNVSHSAANVLRGLHFQAPFPQKKLIQVIKGSIYDVVLDIRPESSTYGKWQSFELDDQSNQLLYIPEGIAHGYLTLQESFVVYSLSNPYYPEYQQGFHYKSPQLAIEWPADEIILSEKDSELPEFSIKN